MRLLIFIGLKLYEVGRVVGFIAIFAMPFVGFVLLGVYFGENGQWVLMGLSFVLAGIIPMIITSEMLDSGFTKWIKRNWHRAGEIDKRRRERRSNDNSRS